MARDSSYLHTAWRVRGNVSDDGALDEFADVYRVMELKVVLLLPSELGLRHGWEAKQKPYLVRDHWGAEGHAGLAPRSAVDVASAWNHLGGVQRRGQQHDLLHD